MNKKLFFMAIFIILLLVLVSCTANSVSNEQTTIKVGFHSNYGGAAAVLTGIEKGYYEEQGLNVELIPFTAGPATIAALNSNSIDFAYVGPGAHSLIISGHAKIIVAQNISNAEAIIAKKSTGINDMSDLKDKTVAVMFGTSSEELFKVALEANNISYDDVTAVNYDMAGAVSALMAGSVDAICVWEQYKYDALFKLGDDAVILAETGDFKDSYVSLSSWVTSEQFIKENENTVQKFVTATIKAQNYWASNTEEVCGIIANELNIPLADLLKGQYQNDIFSIKELDDYLNDGSLEMLYTVQQNYFINSSENLEQTDITDYLITKYMKSAVDYLN